MGRFGFKKGDDDDNDSSRSALFGSRSSKNKSPAPQSQNPYAQAATPPDAYTRAKMNAGIAPPQDGGYQQGPPDPRRQQGNYGGGLPAPGQQRPGYGGGNLYAGGAPDNYGSDNKYGSSQGGQGGSGGGQKAGFSSEKFGNQNGYGGGSGGNPYASNQQSSGASRQGGYGGLGPSNYEQDSNRDELFGGARERVQQQQPPQNQAGGPPEYQYNAEGNAGGDKSYGAYGDRQLTAEEEEEEDITATKQEIRFMKQQDVASTRNALRIAAQAEETGRNTLARLGAQGERMHNTDRNLDIGNNHINVSEDKTKELKTLNRSMFAVHVNNPFTSKDRRAQRDEAIMDRHHSERELREATRDAAFRSTQRMNQNFKGIDDTYGGPKAKTSLAERAKYQFEADSEDEGMENEIDRNLDDLSGAAKRLNLLARATGEEVEQQNQLIQRIAEKVSFMERTPFPFPNAVCQQQLTWTSERPIRRQTGLPDGEAEENPLRRDQSRWTCLKNEIIDIERSSGVWSTVHWHITQDIYSVPALPVAASMVSMCSQASGRIITATASQVYSNILVGMTSLPAAADAASPRSSSTLQYQVPCQRIMSLGSTGRVRRKHPHRGRLTVDR